MGEGSVKNPEKIADVVYGWSLTFSVVELFLSIKSPDRSYQ